MRVLYFSQGYSTHDRRFLAAIAAAGHEAFFLRLDSTGLQLESRSLPAGVRAVEWPTMPPPSADERLARVPGFLQVVRDVDPQLIHAGPVQSCAFIAALAGHRPLVVMSWGSDLLIDACRSPLEEWITSYTLHAADGFVCDAEAVLNRAREFAPIEDDRVARLPWGTDLETFTLNGDRNAWRSRLGWNDAHIVLCVRTWDSVYGIDTTLEAFRLAVARDSRLRLVLAGSGPRAAEVESFIVEHKLEDVVARPGRLDEDEMPALFASADTYLTSSRSDGTSVSLLQALASGLPVVATDIPGNREWITSGENGWLVPIDDAPRFAEALIASTSLAGSARERMRKANRTVAETRADWRVNAPRLISLYERLTTR